MEYVYLQLWRGTLSNMSSILLGLFVFLGLFWFLRRPRNLPPGPIGWPLLGYLPQIAMSADEPHEVFSKLAARYGNVLCVNVAGNLVVVLHGTSTIKAAFAQHQFSGRPTLHVADKRRPGKGIFSSSGHTWTEIRRFSLTVLRGFGIGKSSFEEQIATEAQCLVDEITKYEGVSFDPKHLITKGVSNVICSVVFGKRFHYTDAKFRQLLKCMDDVFEGVGAGGAIEFSPFLARLTFLPFVRSYIESAQRLIDHLHLMVVDHNQDYDADNPRDFIDALLKEIEMKQRQGDESTALTTESLEKIVGDLCVAGSETTTTTLRWSLLYLMAYPEVQIRIQEELDSVTCRNRFPRISDKPCLPYTEAALNEIQRLSNTVPLAVPHYCFEDTTLNGFNIPKGTYVLSNLWYNHLDPSVWEEPMKFRPERFLDKDGNFMSREELTPFGIGRRICLGEHLAKMELFVFFTLLVHQFTFKKPKDAPPILFKEINGGTRAPISFEMCAIPR